MNNLKFRAWLKHDKIMFYLNGFRYLENNKVELFATNCTFNCNLDNVILMQATGLKDVNGKDIYEGDILRSNRKIMSDIKLFCIFENGAFHIKDFDGWDIKIEQKYSDLHKLEVIGNIYENKELVK